MKNSLIVLLCAVIISAPAYSLAAQRVEITTAEEDTKYLYRLAKDTWECMDYYVSPATGFPFDTDQKPDGTNTTNIGLYLASLTVATEMGFIPKDKALKKAEAAVDSLSKLQHWKGFFINTVNVFGDVRASEGGNAISDFNKLPAGLILVRQEFPELDQKCAALLDRMDWSQFYDPGSKTAYGGFDVVKGEILKWPLDLLASDTRLGVFFMVASGGAPPEVWDKLSRETEGHYGLNILKPSWYGGGIFMQGICGLFLDERQTVTGKSMADFAYAQMLFARDIDSPVWGWSSCYSPWNMYLGWGGLRGNVITPHASALAAVYYPNKVVKNLRALEKYGLRQESSVLNAKYSFGFRDSVDIDTGQIYKGYVTALDQGMLFLSLANYLEDGIVWRLFERDNTVKKGKRLLAQYFSSNPAYINLYKKRDLDNLPGKKYAGPENPEPVIISVKPKSRALEAEPGQIDYDISKSSRYVFSRELKSPDISPYDSLSFSIKGDKKQKFTYSLRIELEGSKNGAVYKLKGISKDWRKITIPLREFGAKHTGWEGASSYWGGFITDKSNIKKIDFVFDLPDTSQGKGRVYLTDLSFDAIGTNEIEKAASALNKLPDSPVWENGLIDDFETASGWIANLARGASINIATIADKNGNALKIDYNLGGGKTGRWVVIEKEFFISLLDDCTFKIRVKAEGEENNFEFKLVDEDGSVFGKKIILSQTGEQWREITVKSLELVHWWGGDAGLGRVCKISLAISTKNGGKGTLFLDDLRMISTSRLVLQDKNPAFPVL